MPHGTESQLSGLFRERDHVGRLLLFTKVANQRSVRTPFGSSLAVPVNILVLDGPRGGARYETHLLQAARLRRAVNRENEVLGRLVRLPPAPGQAHGAYDLAEPNAEDRRAVRWLDARP